VFFLKWLIKRCTLLEKTIASIGIVGATYQKFLVPNEITNKNEQHCIVQKVQLFGNPLTTKGVIITAEISQNQN
jgi:hypothetical protein